MEDQVTVIISHIATSHREMSKILGAKRGVTAHMASLSDGISDEHPQFADVSELQEFALQLTKSITAYLNSLADLEDAIAQQTEILIKEMNGPDAEE